MKQVALRVTSTGLGANKTGCGCQEKKRFRGTQSLAMRAEEALLIPKDLYALMWQLAKPRFSRYCW